MDDIEKRELSLNKFQKIELVRMLGLNTEQNILIEKYDRENYLRLNHFILEHNLRYVSVRTMSTSKDLQTPHYPVLGVSELLGVVEDLTSIGIGAIVATCIDPKDALLAGAIWKVDKSYYGEFAIGSHTVRRVTRDGIIDITFEYLHPDGELTIEAPDSPMPDDETTKIKSMLDECTKIPFKDCLIELSYYSVPVGWKKQNVIIWDIDSCGTEDSVQEIENYYIERRLQCDS